MQQFLAKSEGAFRQHPVWVSGPAEHQAQAIEVRLLACVLAFVGSSEAPLSPSLSRRCDAHKASILPTMIFQAFFEETSFIKAT